MSCLRGCASEEAGISPQDFALPLVFEVGLRLMGAPASDSRFWQEHLMRVDGAYGGPVRHPRGRAQLQPRGRGASRRGGAPAQRADRRGRRRRHAGCDQPDPARRRKGALDEAEEVGLAHLVLSASTDAPAALLTNCIAILDKFPALQSYLHATPR